MSFKPGDKVKVVKGPFVGWIGQVFTIARVTTSMFGKTLYVAGETRGTFGFLAEDLEAVP